MSTNKPTTEGEPMTLRELLAALTEYDDDLLDTEVVIEDEFGAIASIEKVVEANGLFLHPTRNFEEPR